MPGRHINDHQMRLYMKFRHSDGVATAAAKAFHYRDIVRRDISGWAQVQQGHVTDLAVVRAKLSYGFYYIKFSAWLDVLIALKTLRTIPNGFGAR